MEIQQWETIVKKKQVEAAAKIPLAWRLPAEFTANISEKASNNVLDVPRKCGLLSPRQLDITESYDATALLEQIHSGKFTSLEVAEAFCIRAAIAQQLTYCLTETFFDRALERAKELDDYLQSTGKVCGPLHGLPISLKDCFNIKGVPSTLGLTSFVAHGPVQNNSAVVRILLELGAVLYVKTNLPQGILAGESHNHIFGRTLNPHRSNLSAGGSSGGEGALIAMRGSILGVGTDIAGSVRIPAISNGTFALRPSIDRIPYGGQTDSARKGLSGIKSCAGPLATSVRDLGLFTKSVIDIDPWQFDSSAIFSTWRTVPVKPKLRLGFVLEDPHFPVLPPVLNTLTCAVTVLKEAGHEVINLDIPSIRDATLLAFRTFAMDPASTALTHIKASGEPNIPALSTTILPNEGMPYEYVPHTLESLYDLNEQRETFRESFREVVLQNNIDAIIMPGLQGTAPPHDSMGWVPYTVLANVLDYPAVIIPYRKANKADDAKYLRDVNYRRAYLPDEIEGAPCAVQVLGRTMREEELLRDAVTIAEVLGV
ncbi:amidase [Aspergillus sclerotioniger CBS 115572]|uniref:amidase n=1 Tax=Aspergillus sclerotioniger CBS 115572 TaxID=1450535 RepID=A0A317WTG5_9EURO|nr:amidase [Aspergillus sclerotioniger CBS 115572]PWY89694.1 amidase [Aspergillus sclerotioniger CBS 115572]